MLALAVLLPAVALAGFAGGAKEAALLAGEPLWLERQFQLIGLPNPEAVAWIHARADAVRIATLAVVVAIAGFRFARYLYERHHSITVSYPDGRRVKVDRSHTLLEASRAGGVPHASVCGGRGHCSTCRVRVLAETDDLPAPDEPEVRVLSRVGAPAGVRLACQLRPGRDVAVVPLLPATAAPRHGFRKPAYHQGAEREIAILFADLRAFTQFAESKLPYDVVFVINQYFAAMGAAVEGAGGRLDKFIGDGEMALFGIDRGLEAGARRSLEAARRMALALVEINTGLRHDLGESLRMGIGIHAGPCVVGEMGYRDVVSMTAIGDAVNTASRLEALTKEFGCQLVVSEVVAAAGIDLGAYPKHAIQVRGRAEPLNVYIVEDATTLPITPPA